MEGTLQGDQSTPFALSVELTTEPEGQVTSWSGTCSCLQGVDCEHAVALTLKAAHMPRGPGIGFASSWAAAHDLPSHTKAHAQPEAEAHLKRWLSDWDQAAGTAVPQPLGGRLEPRAGCYLYLLSTVGRPRSGPPQLQIEAVVSSPKAAGGWTKPQTIRTQPGPGQALYDGASDADRQLLQLLRAMPRSASYYAAHGGPPCGVLEGALGALALQQAAATGRLFADAGGATVGVPLRWGEPLPIAWTWKQAASPPRGPSAWTLQALLPSPSATLCANQPPLYMDLVQGRCGPVHADGLNAAQLALLLQPPVLDDAALQKHHAEVVHRLGGVLPLPPVWGRIARVQGVKPIARLHFAPVPEVDVPALGLITALLRFDYQGHIGWWAGQDPDVWVAGADGEQVLLQRDITAELEAIEHLRVLGLPAISPGLFGIPAAQPQYDWMHWAGDGFMVFRDAGFELSLDAALDGWVSQADTLHASLLPSGADAATSPWFALSLGIEINGVRHNVLPLLPGLIETAAQQPADPVAALPQLPAFAYLHNVGAPGFVRVPTDILRPWVAALLDLVSDRAHDFHGDSLMLSRLDALRTSAAMGEDENLVWEGAEALRAVVVQLNGANALPTVPVPQGVRASLRPYQQQGLNWLQFLRAHDLAGVLADDMGLGKTLQTLAHIQIEKDSGRLTSPALVIAPVSLLGSWQREAVRFCPGLRCLVLHGAGRHAVADNVAEHDIVIAPYSLLQRDRERWLAQPWHLVVLDEAQNIKNASSQAALVAAELQARHRLCLSGTPLENHLGEVWSLFHFLMPGFLGSKQRFNTLFRTPIEKQGDGARMAQLRARIAPFMLRRTKALVAGELPPKVESVMTVELTGAQADLYETIRLGTEKTVREALQTKGLARSQITILDALLKLRQACCHPQLVPLDAAKTIKTSAKLDQLMAMLPGMLAEGRRVLLFSQFTSMLTLIEAELKKRGLPWVKLTGQSQKRDAIIDRFTSGQVPLFLISLKAGGVGLNLPQADTVIHFDPWWNPAVEDQATDRAHRIGQAQSVWVIKLVAHGTIEERILALQERKADLASSLYSESAARKERLFTESDAAELLRPLSQS